MLAYDPYAMLFSTAFILAVCSATNYVFARVFDVPANVESSAITALILALIISPISGYGDLWFLFWASVLAIASKYIINIRGKHIFNPAALGVALTYLAINQSASWWIGNPTLLPFVLVGGLLLARKLRRFKLVWSFMAAAVVVTFLGALFGGQALGAGVQHAVPLLAVLLLCLCHADRAADHPADQRPAQPVRGVGGPAVPAGLPPGVVLHHPGDRAADRQRRSPAWSARRTAWCCS